MVEYFGVDTKPGQKTNPNMTADERFYCFRTREKYFLLFRIKTYRSQGQTTQWYKLRVALLSGSRIVTKYLTRPLQIEHSSSKNRTTVTYRARQTIIMRPNLILG